MAESSTDRATLLARLAERVLAVRLPHPVRVGVDGPDAAGKSTLADELARALAGAARPVIRATIDNFHRPRAERYRRGPDSPEGYYEESYDHALLRRELLDPLGPGGTLRFRRRAYDHRADVPVDAGPEVARPDAILLFDGIFLRHPRLAGCWDLAVFLRIGPDEVLRRAVTRDAALFGGPDGVRARYRRRYLPAQALYTAREHPADRADVLIDNTDPAHPLWL